MSKGITVVTDDRHAPNIHLTMRGQVLRFARVEPSTVRLVGTPRSTPVQKVRIIPLESHPFTILSSKASKGSYIRYTLARNSGVAGVQYTLSVENIRQTAGRYFDTIVLRTDSKVRPELRINVYGHIKTAGKAQKS